MRDTARLQIVKLVCIDPGAGGAVAAAHIIGFDIESGERVSRGIVAEHQVAIALVGISFLSIGIYDDDARKDGLRFFEQGVFVEQIGSSIRRGMRLLRALIKLVITTRHGEREHFTVSPGADHPAVGFVSGLIAAEVNREREHPRVALGHDGVGLKGQGFVRPILQSDIR